MSELIRKTESYKIIGACFEVYKQKGCGFLKPVYQECLALEFTLQKIPFVWHPNVHLDYKGTLLEQYFELDFLCFDNIIVEAKAVSTLIDDHRAQTLNYLNASCFDLALLVNFGHYPKLEYERFPHRKFNRTVSDEIQDWVK
jgi:GxxExxY protein